jgi:putative ABC transport system permease protein
MDGPRWLARLAARLRALFRGRALDSELDEELGFHLEHLIADGVARGLTPDAARREALVAMGGIEQRKEACRDTRGVRLLEDFLQDIRYAARTLRGSPAFTFTAIATLTLGIGTTVAMFSVVNGVLLRPLPFPQPDRLFLVALSPKSFFMAQPGMADVTYLQFRVRDRTFQHLAAFTSYKGNLTGTGDPVVLKVGDVTTEFFDALGVGPAMGRTFLTADGGQGREQTIVISDQLWRARFGADPQIVGKIIRLNDISHTVVGVMPSGFDFPGAMAAWTPKTIKLTPGNSLLVPVVGRLKPDVGVEQARAAFETSFASLPGVSIDDRSKWDVGLIPLKELLVGDVRRPLQLFTGAVLVVLLIACANVANLLLARASGREREIAVRAALGAGRRRLIRQLLTENLLLSAIGAALGVLLARWTIAALLAAAPPGRIPRTEMIGVDIAALGFAAAIAALTGIAFGLAPALRLTRFRSAAALIPTGRTFGAGHERLRGAFVVAEIALALMLLAGAGLMMQSFLRMRAVDAGFNTDNVLRMSVELPAAKYASAEQVQLFHQAMMERLAAVRGVAAAGLVNWLPLGDMYLQGDFTVEGAAEQAKFNVGKTAVSDGYFKAMGIRLLNGREFDDKDTAASQPVAIVSRTVANEIDPSGKVLGRRVSVWGREGSRQWLTVVGVVDDIRQLGPTQKLHATVYQPYGQVGNAGFLRGVSYIVRTDSDPAAFAPAVRSVLQSLDKDQPAAATGLMKDVVQGVTATPAFYARLLGIFAVLAVALALIGTYGVIAYSVAERSHEIGLRMALGASAGGVVSMVLRRTGRLAVAGVAIGTAAAWGATGFLQTLLFEITPTDPATFAAVILAIFAASMLAGTIPARRATRVDPLAALRHE